MATNTRQGKGSGRGDGSGRGYGSSSGRGYGDGRGSGSGRGKHVTSTNMKIGNTRFVNPAKKNNSEHGEIIDKFKSFIGAEKLEEMEIGEGNIELIFSNFIKGIISLQELLGNPAKSSDLVSNYEVAPLLTLQKVDASEIALLCFNELKKIINGLFGMDESKNDFLPKDLHKAVIKEYNEETRTPIGNQNPLYTFDDYDVCGIAETLIETIEMPTIETPMYDKSIPFYDFIKALISILITKIYEKYGGGSKAFPHCLINSIIRHIFSIHLKSLKVAGSTGDIYYFGELFKAKLSYSAIMNKAVLIAFSAYELSPLIEGGRFMALFYQACSQHSISSEVTGQIFETMGELYREDINEIEKKTVMEVNAIKSAYYKINERSRGRSQSRSRSQSRNRTQSRASSTAGL